MTKIPRQWEGSNHNWFSLSSGKMILSIILVAVVAISCFAVIIPENTDATASGSGTALDPRIVTTVAEVQSALADPGIDYIVINELEHDVNGWTAVDYNMPDDQSFNLFVINGQTKHLTINADIKIKHSNPSNMRQTYWNPVTFLYVTNEGTLYLNGNGSINVATSWFYNDVWGDYDSNGTYLVYVRDNSTVTIDGNLTFDGTQTVPSNPHYCHAETHILSCLEGSHMTINGGTFIGYKSDADWNGPIISMGNNLTDVTITGGTFRYSEQSVLSNNDCGLYTYLTNWSLSGSWFDPSEQLHVSGGEFKGIFVDYLPVNNTTPTRDYIQDVAADGYRFAIKDTNEVIADDVSRISNDVWVKVVPETNNTVSFNGNGGDGSMVDVTGQGDEYLLPDNEFAPPDSHQFAGWAVGSASGKIYQPGATIVLSGDVTLYATWKNTGKYAITYNAGYDAIGIEGNDNFTAEYIEEGQQHTVLANMFTPPVGKQFKAWHLITPNGTTVSVGSLYTMPVGYGEDTFLIAEWEDTGETVYTIDFNSSGGSGLMGPFSVISGNTFTLPANEFTKDDLTFRCWEVGTLGMMDPYSSFTVTENVAVSAVWFEPQGLEVVYQGKIIKGEKLDANKLIVKMVYDDDSKEPLFDPANKVDFYIGAQKIDIGDYVFSSLGFADLTLKYIVDDTIMGDISIQVVEFYTVTYNANGGTGTMDPAVNVQNGTAFILPACSFTAPSGKQFKCWLVNDVEKNVGAEIIVNADTTVTAVWEVIPAETYTVTFAANGGTGTMAPVAGVSGQYVLPACSFTAPAGKEFKCWSVADVEKNVGDSINVTANITVTAVWKDSAIPAPEPEYQEKEVDGKKVYSSEITSGTNTDVSGIFNAAKSGEGSVDVKIGTMDISFDSGAVNAIAGNTVSLKAELKTTGIDVEGAKAVVEVTLSGATFSGGMATVTIPFNETIPDGKNVAVYFINGNSKEKVDATYEDGKIVFTTNHFSKYAVMFDDASSPSGGFPIWIVIVIVVVVAAAGVGVFFFMKNKKKA